MMKLVSFALLSLNLPLSSLSFVVVSPRVVSTKTQRVRSQNVATLTRLNMVSSSTEQSTEAASSINKTPEKDKVITNPSTRFGKPITEDLEEFNKASVGFIKQVIFDTMFRGRDYARFYALETIARVPYFSYLAALHFYETIGMWRKANYLKIHFAESWNEMHHLLIMEELGGADRWFDRFIAQHVSVGYYWIVFFLYFWNPTMAYNLNEAIEEHAYATYDQFCKENEEQLKKLPAPQVAREYYAEGDLYMFDEFQTQTCELRRPVINNLYDTFMAIRDDEWEHVKTMKHLQTDVELSTIHDGTCDVPADAFDDIEFAA